MAKCCTVVTLSDEDIRGFLIEKARAVAGHDAGTATLEVYGAISREKKERGPQNQAGQEMTMETDLELGIKVFDLTAVVEFLNLKKK